MGSLARTRAIRRVLIITFVANLAVAATKLAIGLITHSLAMQADGVHSSLDGVSNIVGLVGIAFAAAPPDQDHPYGHRRFETLASMVIGAMLLATAWELTRTSVTRLFSGVTPEIGLINYVGMGITLVANIIVTTYERREGHRLKSEFLLADAEHTGSDVLVSLAIVASLVAVQLGLGWIDAFVALVVVVMIVLAALRVMRRAVGVLVDRAAVDAELVRRVAERVSQVQKVSRVRSRGSADDIHLDLDVEIAAPITAEHSAAIASEVRSQLRSELGSLADIQVLFTPVSDLPLDYALLARAQADRLGLGVHEVIPVTADGEIGLKMHVEVPAEQSLEEAHGLVEEFEQRLHDAIPALGPVVTHIEPAHNTDERPYLLDSAHYLADSALEIAERLCPENDWHDVAIYLEPDGGFALTLHCALDGQVPVDEAHRMAEQVEVQIRAAMPDLHRVTIHTEPLEREA
ncbi:MAG: cation diffusion facilitator family transporter [Anaerolineae bacterium]|nr:cation diffusion facilitator family transporter [Anaerolineae bacterium]